MGGRTDPSREGLLWQRLTSGGTLDDLGVPAMDGRLDLRGLCSGRPKGARPKDTLVPGIEVKADLTTVRGVTWRRLDLSNAMLQGIRFYDCVIEECRFDRADCSDWRMWGTKIVDCTFRDADLRGSALGGVGAGDRRNSFLRVDFGGADLRKTAHFVASMTDCVFDDARLKGVDFQGTVLSGCRFRCDLEEVQFWNRAFRGGAFPENSMSGVDLRGASLKHTEFHWLNMDSVRWPDDGDHFVVHDFKGSLQKVITALDGRGDAPSRRLVAILSMKAKWAGPRQMVGVVSRRELLEAGGEWAVSEFCRLIEASLHPGPAARS